MTVPESIQAFRKRHGVKLIAEGQEAVSMDSKRLNMDPRMLARLLKRLQRSEEFQNWQPETDGIPSAYTPQQIAKAWNVSDEFVRLLFANEPGVLRFSKTGKSSKKAREYTTIRIPKPVLIRVFKKWQKMTRRVK